MRELLVEIFFTFLECFLLYWMVNELFTCKYKGVKRIIFFCIAIFIDTLFVYFCPNFSILLRITLFSTFSFLLVQSLYKGNVFMKIFFIILMNYILIISDMIAGNLLSWIYDTNIVYLASTSLALYIFSKMIAFSLVLTVICGFKKIDLNISLNYWIKMDLIIGFCLFIMEFLMAISSTLQDENPQYSVQIVRISICFLILTILIIYIFGEICLYYQKEQQRYALELKNTALERQLAFQEASASDLKQIRHDIKNNLASISYLLKENHIEESVKYINAISSTLEVTKSIIHSGNKYIDSILNYEITLCKRNNFDIQFEVDNIPELNISPTDLSSVISNILNNAIEANLKLKESERYISLKMFCFKNYLSIIATNPYDHNLIKVDGVLTTDKTDRNYHGYGLKSVDSSVKKYGGSFKYSYENNVFTVMIILPLDSGT